MLFFLKSYALQSGMDTKKLRRRAQAGAVFLLVILSFAFLGNQIRLFGSAEAVRSEAERPAEIPSAAPNTVDSPGMTGAPALPREMEAIFEGVRIPDPYEPGLFDPSQETGTEDWPEWH